MNGAFLVSRDAAPAFEARIAALEMDYGRLTLQSSGPWPPYNFAHFGPALNDDLKPFALGLDGFPRVWQAQFRSD